MIGIRIHYTMVLFIYLLNSYQFYGFYFGLRFVIHCLDLAHEIYFLNLHKVIGRHSSLYLQTCLGAPNFPIIQMAAARTSGAENTAFLVQPLEAELC